MRNVSRLNDEMRTRIQGIIEAADFDFKCDGYQNEQDSDLSLESISLSDADAVINDILGVVADYIAEML